MPMAPKNSATRRWASTNCTAAALVAARQHPVQQVAGGDEVDADQPRAGHADHRRGAQLAVQLGQRGADVAHQLARQLDVRHFDAAGWRRRSGPTP